MATTYDEMSLEDLQDEQQRIDEERRALKARAVAVTQAIDRTMIAAEAQRKYDAMSDAERAALQQIIATNGVASGEALGTPGA